MAGMTFAKFAYFYSMLLSMLGFILFGYLTLSSGKSKGGNLESLPDAGAMAGKFKEAGPAASALACSVLFMVIGTAIGLALDGLKINPFW